MFGIGTTELLVVFGIVLVVFGARRLPELGAGLGRAIKNFKAGISGKDEIDVTPKRDEVGEGRDGGGSSERAPRSIRNETGASRGVPPQTR